MARGMANTTWWEVEGEMANQSSHCNPTPISGPVYFLPELDEIVRKDAGLTQTPQSQRARAEKKMAGGQFGRIWRTPTDPLAYKMSD